MKKLHKKLPFKKLRLPENPAILLPLHAVVTVLVVESICRHSLIAGILFLFQHPYSFLVNALIVAIGSRKKDEISQYFTKLEAVWDEYSVYLGKDRNAN